MFSALVTSHWIPDHAGSGAADTVLVTVDPDLPPRRSVSLLRMTDGPAILTLTPPRADELGLVDSTYVDDRELADRITQSGITLNDPDYLFYLPLGEQAELRDEAPRAGTRRLSDIDRWAFDAFVAAAPEDDLDEAFVELDHWLVFASFVGDHLACAASMYPWDDTRLADLGVITLPDFQGRGLGRATVRAMSAVALDRGYEPQYRCQLDNTGSVALARAAGFALFGEWEVVLPSA